MTKRNVTSLEVLAEQMREAVFRSLPVKAERKCGSRTSHIWQSRQSESAEAELHIFGSQCRTKVRTWKFKSLAVKTERKRNFRSLAVKAGRSAEAEHQIFGSQGEAEVWERNFRSLAVKTERKCGSSTADL